MLQVTGYVDLQVNGFAGVDFLNATTTEEVSKAAKSLKAHGVGAFLPTLITSDLNDLRRAVRLINEAADEQSEDESQILGIHLEGPCLSVERRGVHPKHLLRSPEPDLIEELLGLDRVRIITIAPELPGAIDAIKEIVSAGVIASIGHTNSNRRIAEKAFDAGASTVTHLFNAMEKQGELIELILEREELQIQMIVDDVHVNRELVRLVCDRALHRLICVSDSVAPAGLGSGTYALGEQEIEVRDGRAQRTDGTLAGGISPLSRCLEILREMGYPEEKTLPSITTRPLNLINSF